MLRCRLSDVDSACSCRPLLTHRNVESKNKAAERATTEDEILITLISMRYAAFTLGSRRRRQPLSGHRGQNGMDVKQRVGTGWANVTRRDCRGCETNFLTVKKFATAVTVAYVTVGMRNVVGPSKTGLTQQNVTDVTHRNKTWRLSVVGREA